jgi:omega-6 fatty acid desaturase (delta-12 desaturase)
LLTTIFAKRRLHPVIEPDRRRLSSTLAGYQHPDTRRSLWELAATLVPLALLWGGAYVSAARGWWWGLLLIVPASLFLVRLFMIQHDCGHQAFFRSKAANTWTGRLAGVLTMTPYEYWRRTHAIHHATSGNLDRRGLGAIEMLTVEEYRALPWRKRMAYRIYRHPATLLGLGPTYMFVLQHRLPIGTMRERWAWMSVLGNNLGLLLLAAGLIAVAGPRAFLLAHLPVVVLAATVGVWLFYVQHQFEETYWARNEGWDPAKAALAGSSHLKLPAPLAWWTAHIGAHHIHHAASRIPFYRLPEVLRREPAFAAAPVLTLRHTLTALNLALWDERSERLVSFRAARRAAPAGAA